MLSVGLTAWQVFAIPGGAQAKVEDMSRALLSHVSQIPGKSFFQQVTSGGSNQPLADFGKKLAVRTHVKAYLSSSESCQTAFL